ncbi:endothelial cell-specific chemotaxis regulator isoform X2 [Meles meles]|uniref:endothelial cell-specific chemotaxis regulator isoform X2 n=1 Tax=Meles meles TaxID=9662 RepID=UPI001E698C73|nr:endothelial cell-specific chemotaxis regulator isoform X2 [Meles meles]
MGTVRATRLCWAILCVLLLQGHHSQPRARQTSHPQGNFSSPNRTTEPLFSNIGKSLSSDPSSPSSLASTRTQAQDNTSQVLMVSSKPVTPSTSTSTVDGQSQAQTSTAGLDTSQNTTPLSTTMSLRTREDLSVLPSPTSETVLTVAAFGVISFIVILVVVVIVLVSVVSLRFKCRKNKESEDPQKPGSSGLSESCSTANGEKDSITLISMKNINMNNSKGYPTTEKVL